MTGLVIGVPTLGRPVSLDWAFAFKSINPPINYNTVFSVIRGKPVAEARNAIVEEGLRQKAKYVWFIGDDTINPPHTLRQFIFRMENIPDCGVVGGVYCSKSDPPAPLVFRENGCGSYWDWKLGEFFEVTGLGMDCTLIRTEVFKAMQGPWFKTIDTDSFLDGKNGAEMWTEDLYFLDRVRRETKYKVYCDASVLADHEDVANRKVYKLPPNSLPLRQFVTQNGHKKIVDIGCGKLYREFSEGIAVRVDINEDAEPDYRCDARNLPFENGEFDIVFSSHVLEHFSKRDQHVALEEWLRILKSDGELRLVLPNIEWAAKAIAVKEFREKLLHDQEMSEQELGTHISNVLYGAQTSEYDFHYNGFTPGSIEALLLQNGLKLEKYEEQGYNMILMARRRLELGLPKRGNNGYYFN